LNIWLTAFLVGVIAKRVHLCRVNDNTVSLYGRWLLGGVA